MKLSKYLLIIVMVTSNIYAANIFVDVATQKGQAALGIPSQKVPHVKRFRYVDMNMTVLSQSLPTPQGRTVIPDFTLNLFNDTQYGVKLREKNRSTATATTVWSGSIMGMKYSHVSIASTNGVIAGSLRTDDGSFFKIVYIDNGSYMIQEIDEATLPLEGQPLVPLGLTSQAAVVPSASIDTGNILDIMVVYTPAARFSAGGQAAIESVINASVATMNTTFLNSSIATQVRLVHTEEVDYIRGETGISTGFGTALDDLTNTADGYMDNIHVLRDTYHADMVQLLMDNNSSGGLAWVMTNPSPTFESNAFSVVHYTYADGWAFDHEFGHNMGMSHDRAHSSFAGSYSYSYGYQSPTNQWHTIMSYGCITACPRINYWASPAVTYVDESTGSAIGSVDEADAHATITNNLSIIANWRVSPASVPDLIARTVTTNNLTLTTGQTLTVDISVSNQGDAISDSTTLRYYLSPDIIITTSDTELSLVTVASLSVGGSSLHSANVIAPLSAGAYYLGACVDVVNTELATSNNCSSGLQVQVVLDTDRDGIADSIDSDDDNDGISDVLEIKYGLNPLDASDGLADFDNDGFSNSLEISIGTDMRNVASKPKWAPIFTSDGLVVLVPYI